MAQAMDKLGGQILCSSSRETIMYQSSHSHSGTPLALSLIADTILNPAFLPDELAAQQDAAAYEIREVAADAIPLCQEPDEVIHGDHGLVRCVMLNDRVHALTVDTAGEVAVWDVVRGACLGRFPSEEVAAASLCGSDQSASVGGGSVDGRSMMERHRSPREALETVRERIEGEAVVASWASVDTKTGLLSVHLSERCFEAEIYADEAGYSHDRHFSDEMRSKLAH